MPEEAHVREQLVTRTDRTYTGTNPCTSITVHETANTSRGANAAAHANLQSRGDTRQASWHITVDDTEAVRSFPDTAQCWHAGTTEGNKTSIAVEVCVNEDGDYNKAFTLAAAVVQALRAAHGIPRERVYQHNHWTGKDCPTRMRATGRWDEFLNLTDPTPTKAPTTTKETTVPVRTPSQAIATVNTIKAGYVGLCLQLTRTAYNIGAKYPSAAVAWAKAKKRHKTTSTAGIPAGAPVFWRIPGNPYGHVCVYVGRGLFRTNWSARGSVVTVPRTHAAFRGMTMLGWTEDLNGVKIPGLNTATAPKHATSHSLYPALAIDGTKGAVTIRAWQTLLKHDGYYKRAIDGTWGHYTALAMQHWLRKTGTYTKAYLLDGKWGKASVKALQTHLKNTGRLDKRKWATDGIEGAETIKAEQRHLNAHR